MNERFRIKICIGVMKEKKKIMVVCNKIFFCDLFKFMVREKEKNRIIDFFWGYCWKSFVEVCRLYFKFFSILLMIKICDFFFNCDLVKNVIIY